MTIEIDSCLVRKVLDLSYDEFSSFLRYFHDKTFNHGYMPRPYPLEKAIQDALAEVYDDKET
jgi:hypothetical protein